MLRQFGGPLLTFAVLAAALGVSFARRREERRRRQSQHAAHDSSAATAPGAGSAATSNYLAVLTAWTAWAGLDPMHGLHGLDWTPCMRDSHTGAPTPAPKTPHARSPPAHCRAASSTCGPTPSGAPCPLGSQRRRLPCRVRRPACQLPERSQCIATNCNATCRLICKATVATPPPAPTAAS